ncbi:MAG: DUF559 domain-containing protein, partial [Ignavibacteriae bacterium]|nr:DUF559 domain-containing protein [Ignavibacteriota bacterium]
MLWQQVRNRKLLGEKFVRQFPIFFKNPSGKEAFYIADFYCHRHRLVIELDGRHHYYQQDYDDARTDIIEGMGMKIMRFQNKDIENNLAEVLRKITELLVRGTHPRLPKSAVADGGQAVVPLLGREGRFPPFSLLEKGQGMSSLYQKSKIMFNPLIHHAKGLRPLTDYPQISLIHRRIYETLYNVV